MLSHTLPVRLNKWVRWGALAAVCMTIVPAQARADFPFEVELLFDAKPLPGSKRVPMLEVFEDGRATIDLWCFSGNGRVEISGDKVKVTFGNMRPEAPSLCTPERLTLDEELGSALLKATQWRMEEDLIIFVGTTELRFRLSSH